MRANISPPFGSGRLLAVHGLGQAVVEIADRHFQRLGQLPQAGGRDAVGAALVFLDLLEADADRDGQLLLGQAQQAAAAAQALAQVKVDVVGHGPGFPMFDGLSQNGTARLDRRKGHAGFASRGSYSVR